MSIAYQCYATGEYLGPIEDGGLLPNGATYDAPPLPKEGFALFYRNGKWEYVEDHRKEEGYVNGVKTVIHEVGPLPEGWSTEPPAPTEEELFAQLRSMRDGKLAACDWTVLPDAPLSAESQEAWRAYRQALRDLPAQPGAPWTVDTIPWPVEPSA